MNLLEELLESAVFQQISKKLKTPESVGIQGFQWSCWADSNRRPHPYQLLKSPESTAFQCFRGLFIPEMCGLWSFSLHVFHPHVSPCGSRCGSSRKYRANILSDAGLLLLPICPGNSCYFFHEVALFFRKIIAEAKLLANVK